ncbi:SPOR domain-containing protein [Megalodesulfovibrio gigas]|nr:SPOR domain-containing protein [Megalodesulfovibrio gigas]
MACALGLGCLAVLAWAWRPCPAAAAPQGAQFAIMAERFDHEQPARVLADTLRKRGLNPYLFEALADNGSSVFAVRLDIFDSLLQALAAQDALAQKSRMPLVVTPGGSADPVNLAVVTLFVQTGAYDTESAARQALAELVARGRETAGMIPLHEAGAPPRIVVHAGTYDSYPAAAKAAAALAKKWKVQATVNVMDTALYVSRQVPARTAVPEAFVKKEPEPQKTPAATPAAAPAPAPAAAADPAANATPAPSEPVRPAPATTKAAAPKASPPKRETPKEPAAPAGPAAPVTPLPIPPNAYPPPE